MKLMHRQATYAPRRPPPAAAKVTGYTCISCKLMQTQQQQPSECEAADVPLSRTFWQLRQPRAIEVHNVLAALAQHSVSGCGGSVQGGNNSSVGCKAGRGLHVKGDDVEHLVQRYSRHSANDRAGLANCCVLGPSDLIQLLIGGMDSKHGMQGQRLATPPPPLCPVRSCSHPPSSLMGARHSPHTSGKMASCEAAQGALQS